MFDLDFYSETKNHNPGRNNDNNSKNKSKNCEALCSRTSRTALMTVMIVLYFNGTDNHIAVNKNPTRVSDSVSLTDCINPWLPVNNTITLRITL